MYGFARQFGASTAAFLLVGCTLLSFAAEAEAACYLPEERLPIQRINDFLGSPDQILDLYPDGGPDQIMHVRDLVASDNRTLELILGLVPRANIAQKQAIGAALAQAARTCIGPDRAFALQIQQAVVDLDDGDITVAFAAASGDMPTAELGGSGGGFGAASSGGSGGSTQNAVTAFSGHRTPAYIGSVPQATPQFRYTSAVIGVIGEGFLRERRPNVVVVVPVSP